MSVRDYFARDVRLRHLRLLVAIDDAGRLTRAARLLHVTQPALSKALAEIERAIGAPLFERTPQGLAATPAGATLVRAARAALAELERAGAELQRPVGEAARTLTLGVMPTAGWTMLGDAVARLHAAHPAITVRLSDAPTGLLLPQLVAGRLDLILGARLRSPVPEGIESVPLYDDSMRLVAMPRHPLGRLRSVGWDRAAAVPWVLPPSGHPTRVAFDRALRRQGWAPPATVVEALSYDAVMAMIEALGAIALTPGRLAARLQHLGLVREIGGELADTLASPLHVTAFAAASYHADPVLVATMRCLREASQQPPAARPRAAGRPRRTPPRREDDLS
jgi:DNA-binding transcriptional LysR family regulator